MERLGGRGALEVRPVVFQRGFIEGALGSCLAGLGRTRAICTVSHESGVPSWLQGSGRGWLTAEYAMLPASTSPRKPREGRRGRLDGRSAEIQRLIGRSLRQAVDLGALGELTLHLDCDVIQADGGTRTLAIDGAWVALHQALRHLRERGLLSGPGDPLRSQVTAISVGFVQGELLCDLDRNEDSTAEADLNVVMEEQGRFIEVQASAEKRPLEARELDRALQAAAEGIARIRSFQRAALEPEDLDA